MQMLLNASRTLLVGVLFAAASASVWAQSYPSRPVRMINPFPPGGGTDVGARVIAQKLSDTLGQQVVVENRGGAVGNIGTASVAQATPDGHTVGTANNATMTINPNLYKNIGYDPVKDFSTLILVATYPFIITARQTLPVKSMKDLVALAKANPGKLNFASTGSYTRLIGALFKSAAGMEVTIVPYNGTGPAIIDLIGGHVDFAIATTILPQFATGQLRPLAVTSAKRASMLADLPTVAEAGLPGLETTAWYGLVTQAAVPKPIVKRLQTDLSRILKMPDVRERIQGTGADVVAGSPEEFAAIIRSEVARWAKVIKEERLPIQ
jgi:tripartite-type tricarboxylate transporter receptor subunit TctC